MIPSSSAWRHHGSLAAGVTAAAHRLPFHASAFQIASTTAKRQSQSRYRSSFYYSSSLYSTTNTHENNTHPNKSDNNNNNKNNNDSNAKKSWYYNTKLNSPKTAVAPMVAQSDLAFRLLCRSASISSPSIPCHSPPVAYTQMIHASHFVRSKAFQDGHLDAYRLGESVRVEESGWNALHGFDWDAFSRLVEDKKENRNHFENLVWKDVDVGRLRGWYDQYQSYSHGSGNDNDMCNDTSRGRSRSRSKRKPNNDIENVPWSAYPDEGPLVVQLAGSDPKTVSEAAQIVLRRTHTSSTSFTNGSSRRYNGPVAGIDINCGCPQSIARKGRYGAFLMEESLDTVCDIVTRLKRDIEREWGEEAVGVSAKIRIPEDRGGDYQRVELDRRVKGLVDAGVDLITIHGRTIHENKTKVQNCNFHAIAQAVQTARSHSGIPDFPIIANGGVEHPSDIATILSHTDASAVMSSEALLEHPGLFAHHLKDDVHLPPRQIFQRQIGFCRDYLDLCILFPPLPGSLGKVGGSFNCIRAHLFKMLYRYLEECPDLRSKLGDSRGITSIREAGEMLSELERRYGQFNDDDDEEVWSNRKSSRVPHSTWYRRHREGNLKARVRGSKEGGDTTSQVVVLDVTEKKRLMQERIRKLKEERARKEGLSNASSVAA